MPASLDGKAVEAGGLRHLKGVFLAALDREGEVIAPVTPDTILRGGDVLRFVGMADQVLDLQAIRGLSSAEETHLLDLDTSRARYFEAVIGPTSPMVGTTLKEVGFRQRYQAAVVAIHRAGQRIDAKLGSVPLRVGDTLLLIADPGFRDRWRDRRDFLLVSSTGGTPPVPTTKAILVGAITLAIVLAASLEIIPILQASLLGAVALVVFGAVTPSEARDAVDLDVIIVIAAAFGVAAAVETSGLAQIVADGMVEAFDVFGPPGILTGVVVATVVLTGLVSNNASALLMFPIAVAAATGAGLKPRGFAIAIAVASSVDFLTPIGYQTNTMVYGPGGYRFADYPRLGCPLTLLVVITLVRWSPCSGRFEPNQESPLEQSPRPFPHRARLEARSPAFSRPSPRVKSRPRRRPETTRSPPPIWLSTRCSTRLSLFPERVGCQRRPPTTPPGSTATGYGWWIRLTGPASS